MGFIDVDKAMDIVPRNRIWRNLCSRNINQRLIKGIQSLYEETTNYVIIIKNMKSQIFSTTKGVRQGGGLSPLLFIIFMDEMIRETRQYV